MRLQYRNTQESLIKENGLIESRFISIDKMLHKVMIALVTRPGNDRAKPDALPAPVLRRPRVQLFLVPPVTKHVSDLRIEA